MMTREEDSDGAFSQRRTSASNFVKEDNAHRRRARTLPHCACAPPDVLLIRSFVVIHLPHLTMHLVEQFGPLHADEVRLALVRDCLCD